MLAADRLTETIAALEAELADTQDRAEKIRRAIAAVRDVMPPGPAVAPSVGEAPGGLEAHATVVVRGTAELGARPRLRDAVPMALRDGKSEGATLNELADDLWRRGWLGGEAGPSHETLRQVLLALAREGVLESSVPPGSKAAIWRLANVTLAHAPRYSPEEEAQGI